MLHGLGLLDASMCTVSARQAACKLVTDEAVHPIRRHCTLSGRVRRDVTGASRRNGCTVARSGSVDGLLIGLGAAHCRA